MKIAELESAYYRYIELEQEIRTCLTRKNPYSALSICCDAISYAIPAYKFHKKKLVPIELPFTPLTTLCDFAPPLFERESLLIVRDAILADRSLKKEVGDFISKLDEALAELESARQIWNHLETVGQSSPNDLIKLISIDDAQLNQIIKVWSDLGIVKVLMSDNGRSVIDFCAKWDATVEAYCYGCGVRGKGRKERLFQPISCARCKREGYFFISSKEFTESR